MCYLEVLVLGHLTIHYIISYRDKQCLLEPDSYNSYHFEALVQDGPSNHNYCRFSKILENVTQTKSLHIIWKSLNLSRGLLGSTSGNFLAYNRGPPSLDFGTPKIRYMGVLKTIFIYF